MNILPEMITIAQEAGQTISQFYQSAFTVREKAPDNPVTEADLAADTLLKKRLTQLLPEAGWLSEETADNPGRLQQEWLWVVDPLDGTKEFVEGIPEFAVSVALVHQQMPVAAVVFNPITQDCFSAQQGQGVVYNGRAVQVSQQTTLAQAVVEASRSERKRGEFAPFENQVQVQTMGSIAYKLARVAAGLTEATWSRGPKHEWDICAGVLLVWEAGGRCVDLDQRPLRFNQPRPKVNGLLATNQALYPAVCNLLAPHRHTARPD